MCWYISRKTTRRTNGHGHNHTLSNCCLSKPGVSDVWNAGRMEKQKKELLKITCDNTSLMEQIVSMGFLPWSWLKRAVDMVRWVEHEVFRVHPGYLESDILSRFAYVCPKTQLACFIFRTSSDSDLLIRWVETTNQYCTNFPTVIVIFICGFFSKCIEYAQNSILNVFLYYI